MLGVNLEVHVCTGSVLQLFQLRNGTSKTNKKNAAAMIMSILFRARKSHLCVALHYSDCQNNESESGGIIYRGTAEHKLN